MADDAKKKKKKCSTAEKRMKQNEKSKLRNNAFKSKVRTAVNAFKGALSTKDETQVKTTLSSVYSLMDKGVKTKVYTKNKAARSKSRLSALV